MEGKGIGFSDLPGEIQEAYRGHEHQIWEIVEKDVHQLGGYQLLVGGLIHRWLFGSSGWTSKVYSSEVR